MLFLLADVAGLSNDSIGNYSFGAVALGLLVWAVRHFVASHERQSALDREAMQALGAAVTKRDEQIAAQLGAVAGQMAENTRATSENTKVVARLVEHMERREGFFDGGHRP
jgi:hypothetical protein